MNFVRLYTRVLQMLGAESRLGWTLAVANLALAAAQFAEPVLFGRIIDALAGAQSRGSAPAWTDLTTLLAAWVAFGLFAIVCGALVALHADRLAHRQRHVVMSNYFEHILQLPLGFHGTAPATSSLRRYGSGSSATPASAARSSSSLTCASSADIVTLSRARTRSRRFRSCGIRCGSTTCLPTATR